jgi:uncharacterized RDD family membrane protein YckC
VNELPPPGWYPDVRAPGLERWWDGREWSPATREAAAREPQDAGPARPYAPVPVVSAGPRPVPARYVPRTSVPTTVDGVPLASWGRRAGSWIIDYAITWAIVVPLAWDEVSRMMSVSDQRATEANANDAVVDMFALARDPAFQENFVTVVLTALAVSALLQVVFIAMRGATPGMQVLGLRVRRPDRPEPPSWGRSLLRWMVGYLPFLALGILGTLFWLLDIALPLRDERRQAIHDKAARTLVVRVR